ncbi:MAG: PLP-dependent aminotransferase family protein [Phototrophicaceae bacterium]
MPSHNISINIDRESEEPIYKQLIRQIQMQIESGNLPAGTRLPASRILAKKIDISRISVVNAYAELRAEGFLSAHAGRGTFVSKDSSAAAQTSAMSGMTVDNTNLPDQSLRDLMRMARRQGIINFSHGAPPAEFFPVASLRDAINTVLDRDGAAALTYEVAEGYGPLRSAIRDYVSALGIQIRPSNVLVTGGAQQAIDLVIQALVAEGQTIVTANPTYIGVIDIARTRRINVHGIPTDEHGIRVDALEHYLMEHSPKLIYVMPSFQNPTGRVMPLHRRRQLINLAVRYNVPILEDAIYHEFRFEGESLPPLKALDNDNIVIHVSAFTKMLLPGMRIGYLISDGNHFERLVRVKQSADISTSALNQRAIHLMMMRGVLSHQLERNNRELKRRRDAAIRAAEEHFPPGSTWNVPQGGLYLWAQLPRTGPTAAELFIAAVQNQVAFAIGNIFYLDGCGAYHMRLNYGLQSPEYIAEGFKRLGRAWRNLACDYDEISKSPLL